MSRHKQSHRDSGPNLSQRQLRVGERARHFFTVGSIVFLTSPAVAEVCDKVAGDGWSPQDGAVWMLNPSGFPLELLLLSGGLLLVGVIGKSWLGYFGATVVIANAALIVFSDMIPAHDIYRAAMREGCRSYTGDYLELSGLAAFALAFAWLGYRSRRLHVKAH